MVGTDDARYVEPETLQRKFVQDCFVRPVPAITIISRVVGAEGCMGSARATVVRRRLATPRAVLRPTDLARAVFAVADLARADLARADLARADSVGALIRGWCLHVR
jgi:hypothetical protein